MLGNLGNLAGLLNSAKDLQGQMAKMQEEMAARRFDGSAGGEMVSATVDGKCTVVDLKIDPQALKDVELLEDLVKAAVGAAVTKSQEAMKSEMAGLTGGLNLPGLSALSFCVRSRKANAACGTGLPVSDFEIAAAGITNARINTPYWTTCVHVMPFIPPSTAKEATMIMPTTTPCQIGTSRNRLKTLPPPRI